MNPKVFLISVISIQFFFLALDVVSVLFMKDSVRNTDEPLRKSSLFFLLFIIICYGIIQSIGLIFVPKIEIIIEWFKNFIPSITLINLSRESIPFLWWLILGIFTFYVAGFWDYVIHRFLSHSRSFFFTHEYHHLPNRLFLALPGISVRPFVVFATLPAIIGTLSSVMILLKMLNLQDLPLLQLIYPLVLFQSAILAITHSEFFMGQWWIYRSFVYFGITSPQEHEMHHTVDLPGNYGNFTVIWDRIFGTYVDPTKPENKNHLLGLNYDQDFLGALTAGKLKFPKKMRDYFQIEKYCNIDVDKKV